MAYSKTIFIGNMTRDPELRRTQTGKTVCSFSIAVKRRWQDATDFWDCVAWEGTAETISRHFHKGKEILVEGEMQKRSYEKDGQTRWVTELRVDTFGFVGRKDDNAPVSFDDPEVVRPIYSEIEDDDLPF